VESALSFIWNVGGWAPFAERSRPQADAESALMTAYEASEPWLRFEPPRIAPGNPIFITIP